MVYDTAIITPAHNRVKTLYDAIKSVRNHKDISILHLIVHDTNNKQIRNLIENNMGNTANYRVIYIRRKPSTNELPSASHSLNYGIQLLLDPNFRKEYNIECVKLIGILHDDDLYAPDILNKALKLIEHERKKFVVGQELFFYKNTSKVDIRLFPTNIKKEEFILRSTILYAPYHAIFLSEPFVKQLIRKRKLFDDNLAWGDDRDMLSFIAQNIQNWEKDVYISNDIYYLYDNGQSSSRISNFLDDQFVDKQIKYILKKNVSHIRDEHITSIKKSLKYEYKFMYTGNNKLNSFIKRLIRKYAILNAKLGEKTFSEIIDWPNNSPIISYEVWRQLLTKNGFKFPHHNSKLGLNKYFLNSLPEFHS